MTDPCHSDSTRTPCGVIGLGKPNRGMSFLEHPVAASNSMPAITARDVSRRRDEAAGPATWNEVGRSLPLDGA
ncbi:hypothetical protein acdb102_36920 [Acidothermaceae bacterium B102]|nr:hypothetical protein acdb102_36920 [Acidothermaceae bacterium B102]